MRRVPGGWGVTAALAVMMPKLGASFAIARPIPASPIRIACERGAVRLRAGEDVMTIGRVAAPVYDGARFRKRVRLVQPIVAAVKIGNAHGDGHAFGIVPGPPPDPIASVYRGAMRSSAATTSSMAPRSTRLPCGRTSASWWF